jgi:hypothetical protein
MMVSKAEQLSYDKKYLSPFAKKARENKFKKFVGGKPDDITVVAAQILHRTFIEEEQFRLREFKDEDTKSDHSSSTSFSQEHDEGLNDSRISKTF